MNQPVALSSPKKMPYFRLPFSTVEMKHYALSGFEIPSLPALSEEDRNLQVQLVEQVLYRFQLYLLELHEGASGRSVALQFSADPEKSNYVARVRVFVLCRSVANSAEEAERDVLRLAAQAAQCFPREGVFHYGQETWLTREELASACFQNATERPEIVEFLKAEEIHHMDDLENDLIRYVPHRYWADKRRDSWLLLIETLATARLRTMVRVELAPTQLEKGGLQVATGALQWFNVIDEDMSRKASHGEQIRTDGITTDDMMRAPYVSWARSRPKFIQRGKHCYEQLLSHADRLYGMRVMVASEGMLPQSVVGAARAALVSPPPEEELGWKRPDLFPGNNDSVEGLRWMAQTAVASSPELPGPFRELSLRHLVTAEEAASLFHVPVYDRIGQTSALSTADTPFVIPPETLSRSRFKNGATLIRIGHLYQRERLLDPANLGEGAQGFSVTTNDLMKPSLLVGAPGSGKTNLAVSLLIQLWRERVPFLVLDPSTGQEFRFLLGDRNLRKSMVVYTVGDPTGFPLRFNPFSVPPGVTVRNHASHLLAAFRASMGQMWDPLPAIFEGALETLYTNERFCGAGNVRSMEDRGDMESSAPNLNDFLAALEFQLEDTLTQYKGSDQSIGAIRGASVVRVKALTKKLGSMLNVPGNGGEFFQRLLERPAVIEFGALGDESNIALVMAFLLGQLSGHVEFAYRRMALEGKKREHLILIEEAHRLLGGGEGPEAKSAEDLNTMLAEVRKFGQGIMTLDQRPSSLVGGVLDNAFLKILTRLSDRVGFERLAEELNLDESQKRFAHTRLQAGDAILLDRNAGMPVLVRADNVKDALEENQLSEADFVQQVQANAERFDLVPPEPLEVQLLAPAEAPKAAAAAPEPVRKGGALDKILEKAREAFTYEAHQALSATPPDIDAAKRAVDRGLDTERSAFNQWAVGMFEQLKWTELEDLAKKYKLKAAQSEIADRRTEKPGEVDRGAPRQWLVVQLERRLAEFLDRDRAKLKLDLYGALTRPEPAVTEAKALADAQLAAESADLNGLLAQIKELLSWTLVGDVAQNYQSAKALEAIARARARKESNAEQTSF